MAVLYLSLYPWAAYQTYEWSPGSITTTALLNVIFLHEAGQRVWLYDDGRGRTRRQRDWVTPHDDNVTYTFDDITDLRPEFLLA